METQNPDEDDVKDTATSTTSQQNIDKEDVCRKKEGRNETRMETENPDESTGIDESISEYLDEVGLKKYFPRKLTLKEATEIRLFPKNLKETGKEDLPFLFISKLTSLDSRITWKENLNINGSVRDFIYALLQCSDNHLRQHLMEKLASCQLALPILLPGVRDDAKPELLTWAISRVVKKWKENETSTAPEKRMVSEPVFTTAFIRFGDIPISKSSVLNNVIGRAQGNESFRYFLSFEEEHEKVYNCCGSIEAQWYLPMFGRKEDLLKEVTLLLNLRGDSEDFTTQSEFMFKVANAIFIFVDNSNRDEYSTAIQDIKKRFKNVNVIHLIEEQDRKGKGKRETRRPKHEVGITDENYSVGDSVMFKLDRGVIELSKIICKHIAHYCKDISDEDYISIENWKLFCFNEVTIDQDNPTYKTAKHLLKCLFPVTESIEKVKNSYLQLQEGWVEWVKADKKPLSVGDQDANFQLAAKDTIKINLRNKQAEKGLSEKMQGFLETLQQVLIGEEEDTLHYFMSLFQTHIELMATAEIPPLAKSIDELNTTLQTNKEALKKACSSQEAELQSVTRDNIRKLQDELLEVSHQFSVRNISCEHFIRELGHLYAARLNRESCSEECNILANVAVKLLLKGYSLEILDGENAYMPIEWISGVLTRVKNELKNPRIYVLSIIGIQSSGKSTLLNSMFGARFPVRAGRCTRGLYLQLLKVNEAFHETIGFEYVLIIDTEGLHSPDRTVRNDHTFDNSIATLAMCIGDLTLLNIGQETIGPDMIGVLQIVVHALIRMKKVKLVSNCRIIQQRVSDIAAAANNKTNMTKIKDALNKVTRIAAAEEKVEHIQDFSDVFPLAEEDDLQFFPCLWMGLMSPPNPGYSDKIHALKASILNQDKTSLTQPQFTMEKFISRLKDVWEAVKSEDFVFNFQNSFDALSNQRFRLEHNILIGKMRTDLTEWELRNSNNLSRATKDEFFGKVKIEIDQKCAAVNEKIDEYVKAHNDEDEVKRRQQSVKNETFDIGQDILRAIKTNTEILLQNKEDIQYMPHFIKQAKQELKQAAKITALHLQKTNPGTDWKKNCTKLDNEFEKLWLKKTKELEEKFRKTKISDTVIDEACKKSVSGLLLNTEYSPTYTAKLMLNAKVMLNKVKKWMSLGSRDDNTATSELMKIRSACLRELRQQQHMKPFQENHAVATLTKMYNMLKTHKVNSEFLVNSLMNASLDLAEDYKQYQAEYEMANSLKALFEKEKKCLRNDFLAFFDETIKIDAAVDRVYSELMTATQDIVLNIINVTLLSKMRTDNCFNSKERLIGKILEELFHVGEAQLYVDFIRRNDKFVYSWLHKTAINTMKLEDGWVITLISEELDNVLRGIITALSETAACFTEDEARTTFKKWAMKFILNTSISAHRFGVESVAEDFDLSDVQGFTDSLTEVVREKLKRDVQVALHPGNSEELNKTDTSRLYSKMKKNVAQEILDHLGVCNAVCPFCDVTCHLQISGKHTHVATFHYPQGVAGGHWKNSNDLMASTCTLLMATDSRYRLQKEPEEIWRKYKDYKTDYDSWHIEPIKEDKPIHYWMWVLTNFNDDFARIYGFNPAKIPEEWDNVTPDMAIESLRKQYKHHEN